MTWRRLGVAAILLGAAGAGWLAVRWNADGRLVVAAGGTLEVDGKPVAAGDRVRAGQRLVTAEAPADIRLGSRAAVRLKPGSEAVVRRSGGGFWVLLEKGGLLNAVRPGTKFTVKTPVVAASVRGTVFYLQTDSPERTYACLCNGRCHLESEGFSEEMTADHHKAVDIGPAGAAPAGMLYHTDEDVAEVQALLR